MRSPRSLTTEIPGPNARSEMARGAFDSQHRCRAAVMDDPSSTPFVTPGPEDQCAILDNPGAAQRGDFNVYALRRGVFMNYTGILSVRIRPHLITTRAHVDEAMGAPFDVAAEMTA